VNLHLENKHIVVTGGTRGIGLAIVQAFISEGATVHVLARNLPQEIEINLNSWGNRFNYYSCDVTQEQELTNVCLSILENSKGQLDVLVVNVGNGKGTPDAIPGDEDWKNMWDINFNSALYTVRTFERSLVQNKGNIILISSIAGINYVGAPTAYATAKSALISLGKNLAFKLAPGVRVNCIAPGNIYFAGGTWDLKLQNNPEKVNDMLNTQVPLKRLGTPEDIANMVLFIASEKAEFITGSCMVVDGGQTTNLN
jgi:3-oxoacyl-[acyl-carrier protein] reductase